MHMQPLFSEIGDTNPQHLECAHNTIQAACTALRLNFSLLSRQHHSGTPFRAHITMQQSATL